MFLNERALEDLELRCSDDAKEAHIFRDDLQHRGRKKFNLQCWGLEFGVDYALGFRV